MGFLGDLWKKLKAAPTVDLTFLTLPTSVDPMCGQQINPDECYVELFVESLRIEEARRFATQFHGVVYTFITLAREGDANANLASICKPEKLATLDEQSLGKVITVSRQVMGSIPWRGGTLHLELGLFSVKSGNLLTPVINFVTQVSSAAGISFIGKVAPFVPLLTSGMDMIAGQAGDIAIEVAVDTDLQPAQTAIYAIISAPRGEIDPARITLDPQDRKLLVDGKPLSHGFCVFSLRRSDQKADFGEIPELKDAYGKLQIAIRSNNLAAATDALTLFRQTVIVCPDLITSDAKRLIEKATQKVTDAFQGGSASRGLPRLELEPLSEIGLYSR